VAGDAVAAPNLTSIAVRHATAIRVKAIASARTGEGCPSPQDQISGLATKKDPEASARPPDANLYNQTKAYYKL